jgi:hypothetical protein
MCTVTFIARKHGYALGMNRDEKLSRVTANLPSMHILGGRRALFPSEPGAGTWVGVNQAGIACALINWYAITRRISHAPLSRGKVVTNVLAAENFPEMETSLAKLPLDRVNPFRLIAIFPASLQVIEWRWNLEQLAAIRHPWETANWISSGYDEAGAQVTRRKVFAGARRQTSFGTLAWLRRLHRSHRPARGPYSTCMHRDDAATVSYTEIIVSPAGAVMRYRAGAPCGLAKFSTHQLDRPQLAYAPALGRLLGKGFPNAP